MEIKINKEIRGYEEELFFGMSLRQCIASAVAVALDVCIYLLMSSAGFSLAFTAVVIVTASLPAVLLGFVTYNGTSAWQLAAAVIRCTILIPRHLTYRAENCYFELFRSRKKEVRPRVRRDRSLRKARSRHSDIVTEEKTGAGTGTPLPRTIDDLVHEMSEEEKEREKERIRKKELRRKKALKKLRRLAGLLADIAIWAVISLVLTYIANRTDIMNIIGEWIRKVFLRGGPM